MATEPTHPTLGISPTQEPWSPGWETWSQFSNVTGNGTSQADGNQPFFRLKNILFLVTVLICLCGSVGNGTVIWLLGFCLKRSPFSVYILNLACADCAFLFSNGVHIIFLLLPHYKPEIRASVLTILVTSYLAGLGLLMAVSTERCVSVLCPIWYRCHRPAHLSFAICVLIWGLSLCEVIYERVCESFADIPCKDMDLVYEVMVVITFLVLCVSSLTLLVRVHCGFQKTRPSRLYMTVLLTVLAFLLLAMPYTVCFFIPTLSSYTFDMSVMKPILSLLFILNCTVNPIIYFFVGRHGQHFCRTPLRRVLQRALRDEEETEHRSTPIPTDTMIVP